LSAEAVSEAGGLRSSRDVPVAGRVGSAPVNSQSFVAALVQAAPAFPDRERTVLSVDGAAERVETR